MSSTPQGVSSQGTRLSLTSQSGLQIEASTSATDGLLDLFYRHYDSAFVLENEKEGYDGFAECLDLNHGEAFARLAERFGTFREFILIARTGPQAEPFGGANFIAFPVASSDGRDVLSMNLNYIFVDPPFRRQGLLRRLVGDLPDLAFRLMLATDGDRLRRIWPDAAKRTPPVVPEALVFIEQNDPYRMSRQDYELDTKYAGVDQLARIAMWARLGARIVDFDYVQPPLTDGQEADHNLVYGVLGASGATLDACLLEGHLERFFGISVRKGKELMAEPSAAAQLRTLGSLCERGQTVPLLTVEGLDRAPSPLEAAGSARPVSLRAYLRR